MRWRSISPTARAARVRDEALARLGHVDILVNNAGGSRPTAVDAPDTVWDELLTVNDQRGARLHGRVAWLAVHGERDRTYRARSHWVGRSPSPASW